MSHCHLDRNPVFSDTFQRNLDAMVGLLEGGEKNPGAKLIGFELERILVDAADRPRPYAGENGVASILGALAAMHPEDERVYIDGHLLGLDYKLEVAGERIGVTVSLEPAAQLEVSAGPATNVRALYRAVEAFDAQLADVLKELEIDARLVAAGYDPFVEAPENLELIPKERYRDMDAYLSRHGRYARDMMRCSASTQVSLDYEDEADAMRLYRMGTLLGPLFAFLFDNAPVFRGKPTPGMARSLIWHHVDVDRCGIVPGALTGLTFEQYALWVAGVKPILFTDEQHVTSSTGSRYARDIMAERALTRSELFHLLSMVFPNVRLKGFCEFREMDSLPPRLAAACTSFTGALFYDKCLENKLAARLSAWLPRGFEGVDEHDAVTARMHLEEHGWDAEIFGAPVTAIVDALVAIARENIEHDGACTGLEVRDGAEATVPVVHGDDEARSFDLEGIDMLDALWKKRTLPRNVLTL